MTLFQENSNFFFKHDLIEFHENIGSVALLPGRVLENGEKNNDYEGNSQTGEQHTNFERMVYSNMASLHKNPTKT